MFDSSTKGTPERAGPNVTHVRSRPRGFSTSGVPRHVMPMREPPIKSLPIQSC